MIKFIRFLITERQNVGVIKGCPIKNLLSINRIYTFFDKKFKKGYFFKGESHDFYEVVCVLSGSVGITAGKNVLKLGERELTYHPPGEFHAIWDEGESSPEVIIFSFSASAFPNTDGKIFHLTEGAASELSDIYENVIKCFDDPPERIKDGKEALAAITVKRLEAFLISALGDNSSYSTVYPKESTVLFTNILSVMESGISDSLSLSEIAELCKISIPTLEKTVYKYLGYGVMHHYNTLKMQRAHTLLISGLNVKETALMLGFSNQNYFSSRFKKYFGYPPSKVGHKEGVSQ